LTEILTALENVQDKRRQTFLYSATMAKNFESLFPKELVFGKFLKEDFDEAFKMTVAKLD
jgi:superfamily II DNA/RNA helicase